MKFKTNQQKISKLKNKEKKKKIEREKTPAQVNNMISINIRNAIQVTDKEKGEFMLSNVVDPNQ